MSFRFIAVFSAASGDSQTWGGQLERLSPRIEKYPPNGWVLAVPSRYEAETLTHLSRLGDRTLRVGSGSTRTVAVLAAQANPGTVVPHGREQDFLGRLPPAVLARCLEVNPRTWEVLQDWGVETLAELAALPEHSLTARLGRAAPVLLALARGEDVLFLPEYRPEPRFTESRLLDWPIRELEPLLFVLGSLLTRLGHRLEERGKAVAALRLSLRLETGRSWESHVSLATPTGDSRTILSLVRLELQTHPPDAGVLGVEVEAEPASPRVIQPSLLEPRGPQPEKLMQTLARLGSVVGGGCIGVPQPADSHRPDALILRPPEVLLENARPSSEESRPDRGGEQRLTLRRIRPPRPIRLNGESIVSSAGPWRSSGDWWKEGEEDRRGFWGRDEWDVEFRNGVLGRIFWDSRTKGWFLEGVYD